MENDRYKGFDVPKWSYKINHLAYADDTIIFTSADSVFLKMIKNTLQEYEKVSGQMINVSKSFFYMHQKVVDALVQEVASITGFQRVVRKKSEADTRHLGSNCAY
ncbi:uncharacterized protein LOC124887329 isoform X2 [Capsicum annuum]|uniref:uncharacterized protein LOC124887329 isoform X2 n=1 Tax=Capsicum annuum TaxID=4072 RepID=UPI001FB0F07A|nr:uncharacterized protein LOC124887329 isoform X2 [Capsicum annuum]